MTKKCPNAKVQSIELIMKYLEEDLVEVFEDLQYNNFDQVTMTKLFRLSIKSVIEEHSVSIIRKVSGFFNEN